MPKKAHPMDVARTVVSIMGLEDKETKDNSPKAKYEKSNENICKNTYCYSCFF